MSPFGSSSGTATSFTVLDAIREQVRGPSGRRKKDAAKGGDAG